MPALCHCYVPMNPQKPNMVNSSSSSLFPQTRVRFFSRIRRFLHGNTGTTKHRRPGPTSDQTDKSVNVGLSTVRNKTTEEHEQQQSGKESNTGTEMQTAVKKLHFGNLEEKAAAAQEIRRLAGVDANVREALVGLGVVPSLVSMVGSEVVARRRSALQALTQLAVGTFTKVLIVEAGLLSKLPRNLEATDEPIALEFCQLLHSLSFLSNTQFQLSPSQILPLLVAILESSSASFDAKKLCVATLYNQTTALENATTLVANGAVPVLLRMSTVKEASEKALAALGNLGVTLAGRKALECDQTVPESLIEILTWEDKPKCQELCAYLLMVLAHQSSVQRDKMVKSGIVAVLLEVSLLGSPLVQKRALKLLQWFKDERQVKIGPHSGPQTSPNTTGSPLSVRHGDTGEGKKMMKDLVRRSLYKNMEVITHRAAHKSCKVKVLDLSLSSSSKSLPY